MCNSILLTITSRHSEFKTYVILKKNRTADVIGSLISILTRAGHTHMIGQLMLATSYPLSWFFLIVVPSKNVKELCVTRSNSYEKSLTVAILPLAFPGALYTGYILKCFDLKILANRLTPSKFVYEDWLISRAQLSKMNSNSLKLSTLNPTFISLSLSVVLFRTRLSRGVSSLSRATNSLYGAFIRRSWWPWHIHEWNKAHFLTSNSESKGMNNLDLNAIINIKLPHCEFRFQLKKRNFVIVR